MTCDDCSKCKDCNEKEKIKYCKEPENRTKLVCRNFEFFETLESFNKARLKYTFPDTPFIPEAPEEPEIEDTVPIDEPDDTEPDKELPIVPKVAAFDSWRPSFKNASDIFNELLGEGYTIKEINDIMGNAELSLLNYHPLVHKLAYYSSNFVGPALMTGAAGKYAYEKMFRRSQIGVRDFTRFNPYDVEFPDETQSLIPKKTRVPKPSARDPNFQRKLRTTRVDFQQDRIPLIQDDPGEIEMPDIEDPDEELDPDLEDLPDLEPVPQGLPDEPVEPADEPPPDPPPGPPGDEDEPLLGPKPDTIKREITKPEEKQPLLQPDDEGGIELPDTEPDPEPDPDPIVDPEPSVQIDPFETAVEQLKNDRNITLNTYYKNLLRYKTKDLKPEAIRPFLNEFYDSNVAYYDYYIPILEGEVTASFNQLKIAEGIVSAKNMQGYAIIKQLRTATSSRRPALLAQANKIKGELQNLNADLQSKLQIYNQKYNNYKSLVQGDNYLQGQDSNYQSLAIKPNDIDQQMDYRIKSLNYAAEVAQNSIDQAETQGINWEGEQEVKVQEALDSYDETNGTKINISQGEIEKIINDGGDYETSIGNYYDDIKTTQLNLIENQIQPLQTKFNNFKIAQKKAVDYNQEVMKEYLKFNEMKAGGDPTRSLLEQHQKIKTMLSELRRLNTESTASYTTYFNQRNAFDAVYKDSNDAIKDVNKRYRPTFPEEVTGFQQYADDTNYLTADITTNLNTIQGKIDRSMRSAQTEAQQQAIKNYVNKTTLNEADANIEELKTELNVAKNDIDDTGRKLNNAVTKATKAVDDIKGPNGSLFFENAINKLKLAESLKPLYATRLSAFITKRNILRQAISARNNSDAYTQLVEAGESPTLYAEPANASQQTLDAANFVKNSNQTKIANLGIKYRDNKVKVQLNELKTPDYTEVDAKIKNLNYDIKLAQGRLATANKNIKNAVNDRRLRPALAKAKKEQDIIDDLKQKLLSARQEKSDMATNREQKVEQIPTDANNEVKNELKLPVSDELPTEYTTALNEANETITANAEGMAETLAIDPEIDIQPSEVLTLLKGDAPMAGGKIKISADGTSNLIRAAKGLRSSRVLYTDLLGSRLSATDTATAISEIDAVVEDTSVGQKILAGAGGLLAAGSSFVERGIWLSITKPSLIATRALVGSRIASMIVGGLSRAMGPIGLLLTFVGVGFQIWENLASQPPQNFMVKASNSTRDNLVMPLPEGAPNSFRDTTHDQYGSYQTTSYLNYMKYYLNNTTKFQEAINGGYSAMEAYRTIFTGFPLVYHAPNDNTGEGQGGMGGVGGGQTSPGYYSVDYTNPTEGQAYSYFQLMYNSIKQEYDSYTGAGLAPDKAMSTTITKYQGQINYAQENNRPLYVSRYVQENGSYGYGSVNGYSEKDTAKALAEFKQNPFIFAGLPKSTLQLMGLPDNINDPDFLDSDQFQTITEDNSFYDQENTQVELEVKQAVANAQVSSYKKLISTIPPEQTKVRQYFLYQLDQLQQDPTIASDLTGLNKLRPAYVPPLSLIQQDYLDILSDPYYFSINAAWDAQTSQFTNIEEFSDDNINALPSWFSLDPTEDNDFDVSTIQNAKLALETNLKEQLGLYDYNLATMGSEGGKVFQDSYTYNTNTLQDLDADLAYMKSAQGFSRLSIPGPDAKDINYLYLSYMKQYQVENVDDADDAAWQTIINQLQLAVNNGDQFRVYTELNPAGQMVNAASAMGALNSSQLAYYQALYNEDHTRYLGYSSAALLALGLNINLQNGELSPGETVGRNNEAIDPDLLAHFTSMISDRNAQLTQLEIAGVQYGQPIPVYEPDGKFSGTWMNPSDTEYQSTFQTEFPSYIYRPTGYDPYGTTTQTDEPQDSTEASQPATETENTDNN